MTEKEIRKQVKKEFRHRRLVDFLDWLKNAGLFILLLTVVTVLVFPFCAHLCGVTGDTRFFFIELTHTAMIVTGICAIPCAFVIVGSVILIVISIIEEIKDKIQEHKKEIENVVKYRMKQQEKEDK